MVGFYGGAPLEYAGITEQGSDAVPSGSGEVLGSAFGEGLAQNLTPRIFRSAGRFAAETGVLAVDDFGRPIMGEPEPTISPESANAEYGIKGHLSFDKPVPRSVAQDLRDHKQAQIEREDTIARRQSSLLTGGAARFSASLMAGALDPINLAVGFIPVIGEAREAALIANAGSAAARFGTRAGLGGAQGAAAMTALQPLEFGLSRQEQEDYTMATALRSIALGTVLGGGLHAGIGAALDHATGRYRNPLSQRLEDAGPEARETLLQGALAQSIEGRPVDVAPALDAFDAARRPENINEFLISRGGVFDEGGELRAMDLNRPNKGQFGILSTRNGLSLDYAREAAEEAGFLRPGSTINDLLDAIQQNSVGHPVYRPEDAVDFKMQQATARRGEFDEGGAFDPNDIFAGFPAENSREWARSVAETIDAARRSPEADALVAREATDIQARAPEPPALIDEQIAEAQKHLDAVMRELQPEAEPRDQISGEAAKTNPAPENKVADIPELRQADEMVARAEGDARAYEAAANCIAEKGL